MLTVANNPVAMRSRVVFVRVNCERCSRREALHSFAPRIHHFSVAGGTEKMESQGDSVTLGIYDCHDAQRYLRRSEKPDVLCRNPFGRHRVIQA